MRTKRQREGEREREREKERERESSSPASSFFPCLVSREMHRLDLCTFSLITGVVSAKKYARCDMKPNNDMGGLNDQIKGLISFAQEVGYNVCVYVCVRECCVCVCV